jgi:hypothetical protein
MEENIDPFEDLKTIKKMVIEMKSSLHQIATNQPRVILNNQEIANGITGYLPDFKSLNEKIDSIPKSVKTEINWVHFIFSGWKMFAIWIICSLAIIGAANYKLLWMHYEKVQTIKNYEEQIEKLRKEKPKTANQYFPKQ